MRLSDIGEVVRAIWESLPERYPGVELDESVIMPNHMHGIIVITPEAEQAAVENSDARAVADRDGVVRADVAHEVRADVAHEVRADAAHEARADVAHEVRAVHEPPSGPAHTAVERRRMLLPKVVGYFKMNTAKRANQIRSMPGVPFGSATTTNMSSVTRTTCSASEITLPAIR